MLLLCIPLLIGDGSLVSFFPDLGVSQCRNGQGDAVSLFWTGTFAFGYALRLYILDLQVAGGGFEAPFEESTRFRLAGTYVFFSDSSVFFVFRK